MKIMTCNVRTSYAEDGDNSWNNRKPIVVDVLRLHAPDVVCFQEMSRAQFLDVQSAFPGFDSYGTTDRPLLRNPVNAIFYDKCCFERISGSGYWLSETPHVPGTSSWESRCIRVANWVILLEKQSQKELRIINTHLDHVSQLARENQGRVIIGESQAFPDDYPQVLTGDMNCDVRNSAIQGFKDAGWTDTYELVRGVADPGPTYHAFLGEMNEAKTGKMDWIFCRGGIEAKDAEIITDRKAGRYPSDHYFVSAELDFTNEVEQPQKE